MARVSAEISLTETVPFRRLVQFLQDAEDYARLTADDELAEMVEDCRADMLELRQ